MKTSEIINKLLDLRNKITKNQKIQLEEIDRLLKEATELERETKGLHNGVSVAKR